MALFEGTVAFVMISAAMKSMDPSLEESSRVLGAGKLRTALRITLPLVAPGVLSATIFVFAEMLGSFAAAFVLGIPGRFYVVTTEIWQATLSFPPDYGRAAAMGLSLFGVMLITLTIARFVLKHGTYTTITGKAFRPREMDVGAHALAAARHRLGLHRRRRDPAAGRAAAHLVRALRHGDPAADALHTGELRNGAADGLGWASVRQQPDPGCFRSDDRRGGHRRAGLDHLSFAHARQRRGGIRHHVSAGGAAPGVRAGLLWAWINMPIPIYGTLWLLGLAYFTVFLPLGLRTIASVVLQVDPSLEECARVCGAGWVYQMRTVTMPLLRPGLVAAWLLIFIASVRELGVSIFLMGPNSKVIAPAIVNSWLSSSSELSAAMALIQTATVFIAVAIMFSLARRVSGVTQ